MLKASQQQLLQATNIGLLNIRQIELNYYTYFFSAFSAQCAILCGFTYSAVTQMGYGGGVPYTGQIETNDGGNLEHLKYNYILYMFWFTSAICMMAALHNIFCSTLIMVMGPARALLGPIGSMSIANEGMRAEMKHIVVSYVVMCTTFAMSTASSFWVVMGVFPASCCTAITMVASYFWYTFALRIYNRFYFDELWSRTLTEDTTFVNPAEDEDDDPMNKLDLAGIRQLENANDRGGGEGGGEGGGGRGGRGARGAGAIRLNPIHSSRASSSPSSSALSSAKGPPPTASSGSIPSQILTRKNSPALKNMVLMEGHMHKKAASSVGQWVGLGFGGDDWKRRYFVLMANGDLWYYKSARHYQVDPSRRLKERAIELAMYQVQAAKDALGRDADDDADNNDDVMSEGSQGSPESSWNSSRSLTHDVFLVPDETVVKAYAPTGDIQHRVWHFRFDQKREQEEWVSALTKVSSASLSL